MKGSNTKKETNEEKKGSEKEIGLCFVDRPPLLAHSSKIASEHLKEESRSVREKMECEREWTG